MKTAITFAMWTMSATALASCASQPPAEPSTPASVSAAEAPEDPRAEQESVAPSAAAEATPAATPRQIDVPLEAKSGSKLTGKAVLTETEGGVHVVLTVEGIAPGEHGTHIHEKGDCSSPDGESAGGHFNPGSHPHGMPGAEHRHLGDLGNITIGQDGKGKLDIVARGANLKATDPSSFVGRALIVHTKKDDGGQPTGNAGGRIGCGVIKG
jgi:Cu-Zn family superoxide dismutase